MRVPVGLPAGGCQEPVLKTLLFSLLGFCGGGIAAWAIGVFVLQLPWETAILLVEVVAVAAAVTIGALVHRRQRTRPSAGS
jgi:predicted lysophospholipase L1 biosynthesis ABC-type transport system permease subunit